MPGAGACVHTQHWLYRLSTCVLGGTATGQRPKDPTWDHGDTPCTRGCTLEWRQVHCLAENLKTGLTGQLSPSFWGSSKNRAQRYLQVAAGTTRCPHVVSEG